MNNLSKLQSEAVKELMSIEDFEESLRFDLNEDWYERTQLEKERVIKLLLSDQIQKAYSNGREEVVKEFDKQWADLGVGGKHPPWHVWIENCQLRCLQGTHLDWKKLSIQSKGKMK